MYAGHLVLADVLDATLTSISLVRERVQNISRVAVAHHETICSLPRRQVLSQTYGRSVPNWIKELHRHDIHGMLYRHDVCKGPKVQLCLGLSKASLTISRVTYFRPNWDN